MAVPTPLDRCLRPVTGLVTKAQTGFAMYALLEEAARLRPAMSDPEIMLDILSL
jgi:chorismate mutase